MASYLSYTVINACQDNNIKFVFLPPNATHLCQPLDVAYFRPLKRAWKKTLEAWKKDNKGCVPKHVFVRLLKQALKKIEANSANNMKSGFRACGIHPLNRFSVLRKIPNAAGKEQTNSSFSDELVLLLKEERFGRASERNIPKRRRLVDIQPGASVSEDQVQQLMANRDNAKNRSNLKRKTPEPTNCHPLGMQVKREALETEEQQTPHLPPKQRKRENENEAPSKTVKTEPGRRSAKNSRSQKKPTSKLRI